MIGIIYAVLSALIWGTGDFFGGLASRRNSQFQVLVLVSILGAGFMFVASLSMRESWLSPVDTFWAAGAGLAGAVGIAALYTGLSRGHAALVSPVAAVLSAALPLLVSLLTEGVPAPLRMAGLVIAVPGIWQVTRSVESSEGTARASLGLAILAGAGFAGFFVLIAQLKDGLIFAPLVISKGTAFLVGLLFLWFRKEAVPTPVRNPAVLLAALFDAGGNVFFLLAEQNTRLDIAAVLSSMYAAVTVLLFQFLLKERVTRNQWLGVGLCLLAIGLIVI
jgi:drug/metabolite transporter (DMT)-like permease